MIQKNITDSMINIAPWHIYTYTAARENVPDLFLIVSLYWSLWSNVTSDINEIICSMKYAIFLINNCYVHVAIVLRNISGFFHLSILGHDIPLWKLL